MMGLYPRNEPAYEMRSKALQVERSTGMDGTIWRKRLRPAVGVPHHQDGGTHPKERHYRHQPHRRAAGTPGSTDRERQATRSEYKEEKP
jgi:hypothetical protein